VERHERVESAGKEHLGLEDVADPAGDALVEHHLVDRGRRILVRLHAPNALAELDVARRAAEIRT